MSGGLQPGMDAPTFKAKAVVNNELGEIDLANYKYTGLSYDTENGISIITIIVPDVGAGMWCCCSTPRTLAGCVPRRSWRTPRRQTRSGSPEM